MTTATRSVAVVATRLPMIDRRALSQAWYSALHVPQVQAKVTPARVPGASLVQRATPVVARPTSAIATPPAAVRQVRQGQRELAARPATIERRGPATELSRRIGRALVHYAGHAPAQPVTLAIKAGDGRVQLLVRNDGSTTRIVALCAPHLRERVDRALAQARFALAAVGTRVEAAV